MLAKMASKVGGKSSEDSTEMENKAQGESNGPGDEDEIYKAGAVVADLKPKLMDALRAKDPEKYDAYMNEVINKRKSASELLKQGKVDEYKKAWAEANTYGEKGQLDTYLTPDEMKKVLGKDYDPFISATKKIMQNQGEAYTRSGNVVGEKEKDSVSNVGDINFGKRFLLMNASTGIEASTNGKKTYGKFYKYNPQTGQSEIDTERSYGLVSK